MASDLLAHVSPRTVQASGRVDFSSSVGKVAQEQSARQSGGVVGKDLPAAATSVSQVTTTEQAAADQQKLAETVNKVNEHVQTIQRALEFSVDEDSHRTVITVRDSSSGDVIRTIPSEELLKLAKHLHGTEGMLVREKA